MGNKASFDTNVLISALINGGKPCKLLRKATLDDEYILITSNMLLEELAEVLHRPKFKLGGKEMEEFLDILVISSVCVAEKSKFQIVGSDPDDNMIINTAYDGHADWIVSGDSDLLDVGIFRGIRIVLVAEMLDQL